MQPLTLDIRQLDSVASQFQYLIVLRRVFRSFLWSVVLIAIGAVLAVATEFREEYEMIFGFHEQHWNFEVYLNAVGLLLFYLTIFWGLVRFGSSISLASLLFIAWVAVLIVLASGRGIGLVLTSGAAAPISIFFVILNIIILLIGAEILACAALLFLSEEWQSDLIRDETWGPILIDAPPAIHIVSLGRSSALIAFITSAAIASVGAAIMTMSLVRLPTTAITFLETESCKSSFSYCITSAGFRNDISMKLIGLALACLLAAVASWLASVGRSLVRKNASEAMQYDRRPPIVFLRSFQDDQVQLPGVRVTPLRFVLNLLRRRSPLDHLLIEEFSTFGPVIAIGQPGEIIPPYGAWRSYVDNTETEQWKKVVAELTKEARAIVLVADSTAGVTWEIDHLTRHGHIPKTIFITPPRFQASEANKFLWTSIEHKTGVNLNLEDTHIYGQVLAAFGSNKGSVCIALSRKFGRNEYLMALRWFFRENEF